MILGALCMPLFAQDAAAPATDTVILEYIFSRGDVNRYKTTIDMNVNVLSDTQGGLQIPSMALKMVGFTNQTVSNVLENGDGEIISKVESMKMTMMGSTNEMPVNQMPAVTTTMTKTGLVKSISRLEKVPGMLSGIPMFNMGSTGSQFSAFPGKPVATGDTWIQDIPSPLGGNMHSECKLLEKDARAGSYTVAVYSENASGDVNFNMDPSKVAGETANGVSRMGMTGKFVIKGTSKFSTEYGKMISTSGTMDIQMDMEMPAGPGAPSAAGANQTPIKMNITGTYTMFIMPPAVSADPETAVHANPVATPKAGAK